MNQSKSLIHVQSRYARAPQWTNREIRRFIQTRIKYESFFDQQLYCKRELWEKIAIEARIPENWRRKPEYWRRLKKKWLGLVYKYRKIHFRPDQDSDAPITITWPFYDLIHKYESKRYGQSVKGSISKNDDLYDDTNNAKDTNNCVIDEQPLELRTYTRVAEMKHIKSTEPAQPFLRIDQTIFKQEPLDIDTDPVIFKIEDDSVSDTEVYEIIASPKQDYPSDMKRYGQSVKGSISKNDDLYDDTNNAKGTNNCVIDEQPLELRTYTRVAEMKHIKSTEPAQPFLRIDQTIFKQEPLDIDTDPVIFKIEDDSVSDTEVYEIIASPKQDYPSDPVEYETYDVLIPAGQLSPQPYSPVSIDGKPCATDETHVNLNYNQNPEKSTLHDEPKKRKKSTLDEDETMGEKKLRREILKCTNVFLKFMKMKYDIDPDPSSDESNTD